MTGDMVLMIASFGAASSLALLAVVVLGYRHEKTESRLADISGQSDRGGPLQSASSVLPSLGAVLMPQKESNRGRIQTRMLQAGLYRRHAAGVFFGAKLLLMVSPLAVAFALGALGLLPLSTAVLYGAVVGLVGTLAPGLWLRGLKARRQKTIRRALPDALDVIVICVEGGLSLSAAFARVTEVLHTAYPLLAAEMGIMRKEMELGRSIGEAIRDFGDRFDAEELRAMGAMITQAERFGASLVRTLRVQADSLRLKRHQHAEAQAQKAPLKLIFPTVLCIFPALYIVLMGPAGVQFFQMLEHLGQ